MANRQTDKVLFFGDLVTAVRTSAEGGLYPVGTKREEEGATYRYVSMDSGATAAVANKLAFRAGSGSGAWVVTATVANTAPNLSCGVFVSVIAASGYGWIQTKGRVSALATDGTDDIVKGDVLIETLATTGTVRLQIIATADTAAAVLVQSKLIIHPVGVALDADVNAANTVDCMVDFE